MSTLLQTCRRFKSSYAIPLEHTERILDKNGGLVLKRNLPKLNVSLYIGVAEEMTAIHPGNGGMRFQAYNSPRYIILSPYIILIICILVPNL